MGRLYSVCTYNVQANKPNLYFPNAKLLGRICYHNDWPWGTCQYNSGSQKHKQGPNPESSVPPPLVFHFNHWESRYSFGTSNGSKTGSVPEAVITHSWIGWLKLFVGTFSMARTTSMPSSTLPITTCFPLSQAVTTVIMENCDPLVLGPDYTHTFRGQLSTKTWVYPKYGQLIRCREWKVCQKKTNILTTELRHQLHQTKGYHSPERKNPRLFQAKCKQFVEQMHIY